MINDAIDTIYLRDLWLVSTPKEQHCICSNCKHWTRDLDKYVGVCYCNLIPDAITSYYYSCEYFEGEDDKSVLSDLSHADLGFGGEDSG